MNYTIEQIQKIIDDAMQKRDRSIYLYFNPENGISMNIYPWPDINDFYEMYKDGSITFTDFRIKMGLPITEEKE